MTTFPPLDVRPGCWRPFVLFPAAAGHPTRLARLTNYSDWRAAGAAADIESEWTTPVVTYALMRAAAWWHFCYRRDDAPDAVQSSHLRKWIKTTEEYAARLPHGRRSREAMQAAARAVREQLDWRAQYFRDPLAEIGTKRDTDRRCSELLWALDRFVRAVNNLETSKQAMADREILGAGPTASFPSVGTMWKHVAELYAERGEGPPIHISFADYDAAQKRIARIEADILPGKDAALMADILQGALTDFEPVIVVATSTATH